MRSIAPRVGNRSLGEKGEAGYVVAVIDSGIHT